MAVRTTGKHPVEQREVSQFIVTPPRVHMPRLMRERQQFEDYLEGRSPGWSFDLCGLAPVADDEDFCVIPIMNFATPDGDSYMCRPLQPWVRAEILVACRRYLDATKSECRYGHSAPIQ